MAITIRAKEITEADFKTKLKDFTAHEEGPYTVTVASEDTAEVEHGVLHFIAYFREKKHAGLVISEKESVLKKKGQPQFILKLSEIMEREEEGEPGQKEFKTVSLEDHPHHIVVLPAGVKHKVAIELFINPKDLHPDRVNSAWNAFKSLHDEDPDLFLKWLNSLEQKVQLEILPQTD